MKEKLDNKLETKDRLSHLEIVRLIRLQKQTKTLKISIKNILFIFTTLF